MKTLFTWLLVPLALTWAGTSLAETDSDLCDDSSLVFGFFNGVQTTPAEATRALEEFRRLHGSESPAGDTISYEVLYNYSNGFEDFVETFDQRLREHDQILEGRFELFMEAIYGGGPWWDDLVAEVSSAADLLKGVVDWYEANAVKELTELIGDPPTTQNYAEHQARIDTWILEGNKLLFVAHSQGNLFANSAFDYAAARTASGSVGLVHIAPASPTLRGSHTLADLDLVINGLRVLGQVPPITDQIPGYLYRPPGLNGETDALGHGLLEIYLNPRLAVSQRVSSHIEQAMSSLVSPPQEATSGFFTVTLTWDGYGDVDLHTFEPGGVQVYFYNSEGVSGYLDVDDIYGPGPEHYFASCDANRLQTGSYVIAVANYSYAEGRIATVQVSTERDGVLGTKSVQLGPETGKYPGYFIFEVKVEQDPVSHEYLVSLLE